MDTDVSMDTHTQAHTHTLTWMSLQSLYPGRDVLSQARRAMHFYTFYASKLASASALHLDVDQKELHLGNNKIYNMFCVEFR